MLLLFQMYKLEVLVCFHRLAILYIFCFCYNCLCKNDLELCMKRVQWLDIAKFFFILIVIYSHLESAVDEFSCLIVPIMLPGFLFASGYAHRSGQDFKSFFIKKFRTLFVPWLILSIFDISLSQIASFGEHNYFYELGWNFLQIRGRNDQLWFVAALFTAYIPFYFYRLLSY